MSQRTPTRALVDATRAAVTYHGTAAARAAGATAAVTPLPVARAPGDEPLTAPLLEDLLYLLVRVVQRLLRGHSARRRVGEHGGEDEGVEHFALGRVRRSRVSDVRRPLQGGADRLQLRGRVRAEGVVGRHLLQPLVARGGLLRHGHARVRN